MLIRFHYTSYNVRMWMIAILMGCAYTTVAFSSRRALQLLGVVFSALQGGLGEASCLAMCTFFDSRAAITFWSSGTGFAGILHSWVARGLGSMCTDTFAILQDWPQQPYADFKMPSLFHGQAWQDTHGLACYISYWASHSKQRF